MPHPLIVWLFHFLLDPLHQGYNRTCCIGLVKQTISHLPTLLGFLPFRDQVNVAVAVVRSSGIFALGHVVESGGNEETTKNDVR